MTESRLWNKLKRALPEADMTRHEERGRRGVPDVSYGLQDYNGWIELKAYDKWPSDPAAPVPFRNLKPWQRRWLKRRGAAGGRCFVMAAIGKTEIILIGWQYVDQLGKLTKNQLLDIGIYWRWGLDWTHDLRRILTGQYWPAGSAQRPRKLTRQVTTSKLRKAA